MEFLLEHEFVGFLFRRFGFDSRRAKCLHFEIFRDHFVWMTLDQFFLQIFAKEFLNETFINLQILII